MYTNRSLDEAIAILRDLDTLFDFSDTDCDAPLVMEFESPRAYNEVAKRAYAFLQEHCPIGGGEC